MTTTDNHDSNTSNKAILNRNSNLNRNCIPELLSQEEGRYSSLQHPRFANFLLAGLLRRPALGFRV